MGKIRKLIFLLTLSFSVLILAGCPYRQGTPNISKEKNPPSNKQAIIADFNSSLINNLQGESGAWESDPDDFEQSVVAELDTKTKVGNSGASLKLSYDVDSPGNAVNGFWTQLLSFDASRYDHLEFWVKGDTKKGYPKSFKIEFKKLPTNEKGQVETIVGTYVVEGVSGEWQKISIPLNVMNGITDWKDMAEFVITFEKRRLDKKEGVLYFDDIAFVKTGDPGPSVNDVVPHARQKTEKGVSSKEFAELLVKRLGGFPEKVIVKKEFPEENRAFLMELAKDLWRFFDEIIDVEHQLPLDNIGFSEEGVLTDRTRIGDYTNVTNIGIYLMCVVSAYDLGFITKEEALKKLNATLDSMERLEKYEGFPYNYYDLTIFQRTSNFISFVDSGWFAAGIIVAKNAFPEELSDKCQKLLEPMNFSFFYDPVDGQMYHGFFTNINYYSNYHYGAFYTEPRAISYLAIGKGDVPAEHWFMLSRTFPADWLWQTQTPKDQHVKECMGYEVLGGYYIYGDMKFVPSWGGSMFEALMPTLVLDEKGLAPKALGLNDERHAKIQIKYALEELGYPVFGMSPSCTPAGGYSEYGVMPLGIKGYKAGVITPHATFLALEFAPEESVENLKRMLKLYNAYGEYGFYDAIDIETGKAALNYLSLDQGMSFIALNNYLNDGAIRKRFHAEQAVKNAEELLSAEDFFN